MWQRQRTASRSPKQQLQVPEDEYVLPETMFVISDIEGNFAGLKMILQSAGVIDKALHWSFGKGHFVFNGDLFDRGGQVTECLWFIYKLESEAEAAGGKSISFSAITK